MLCVSERAYCREQTDTHMLTHLDITASLVESLRTGGSRWFTHTHTCLVYCLPGDSL